jgi:hypothetical protein
MPGPGQFRSSLARHRLTLRPFSGTRVVGVDATGKLGSNLGLYLLGADDTELSVVGRGRNRTLIRTSSRITRVAIATNVGLVAYVTESAELGFVERSGRRRYSGMLEGT